MSEYAVKNGHTCRPQTGGSKQLKQEFLQPGQAADINVAPPTRLYSRDYSKVAPRENTDSVGPYLGNPLGR